METEKKEGATSSDVERTAEARRRTRNADVEEEEDDDGDTTNMSASVERVFEGKEVPGWTEQLTVRAFAVSAALGLFLSFIVTKLNLTTGIVPSLNVPAGLLGFFLVKLWVKLLENTEWFSERPFTRQENTVIQTCVVACYGIAFSGGFGSYILAMSSTVAQQQAAIPESETPINIKEPSLGWLIAFMFAVSFVGLFSIVPLRKIMIIDYKLTYPSGTATAHLINSFHTPHGATLAKKQVSMLFKSFVASFFWSFFQWFYAAGDGCGFSAFPTFGLEAFRKNFYFDFSASYVGVGMICPYMINISLLLGAIISWGVMWPFIEKKKGIWFDAALADGSLKGLSGYKVFIPISMILGDGLSNLCLVASRSALDMYRKSKNAEAMPVAGGGRGAARTLDTVAASFDERRRTAAFLKDEIPLAIATYGYAGLAGLSALVVPLIFPQLRPYHVAALYAAAPAMAFCNAYGCGLTDWSLASSYGKLAIFAFGSWVGMGRGGIVAGLASCGVMMSVVSTASDLMQDFKTGYLTLASQRSMLVSQAVGTAMGCVAAPGIFWMFKSANDVGSPGSPYPAPYAGVYRGIALIGVEGLGALPEYCVNFCAAFFAGAFLLNAFREMARRKRWSVQHFLPSAMGMAVPFFIGAYFTIDMCVGSLILFLWERSNKRQARAFAPAVASGLLCGDGLWSLPASVLALLKVEPPICMRFFSREDVAKVAGILT